LSAKITGRAPIAGGLRAETTCAVRTARHACDLWQMSKYKWNFL
jgi:hypothetical protein